MCDESKPQLDSLQAGSFKTQHDTVANICTAASFGKSIRTFHTSATVRFMTMLWLNLNKGAASQPDAARVVGGSNKPISSSSGASKWSWNHSRSARVIVTLPGWPSELRRSRRRASSSVETGR